MDRSLYGANFSPGHMLLPESSIKTIFEENSFYEMDTLGRMFSVRPWDMSRAQKMMSGQGLSRALAQIGLESDFVGKMSEVVEETGNNGLVFSRFKAIIENYSLASSLFEWSKTVPFWKILSESILEQLPFDPDPLRTTSGLKTADVDLVAASFGTKSAGLLHFEIQKLRTSFRFLDDAEVSQVNGAGKFAVFKAESGKISDFHGGLVSRIGASSFFHFLAFNLTLMLSFSPFDICFRLSTCGLHEGNES
jgi:hypothetical protein